MTEKSKEERRIKESFYGVAIRPSQNKLTCRDCENQCDNSNEFGYTHDGQIESWFLCHDCVRAWFDGPEGLERLWLHT